MIRNLKVLGLALVAVFALSAIAASAASAQVGTLTSDGPVKLVGTTTGGVGANQFAAKFGEVNTKVECPNVVYSGFKYNETPHKFIPNDVSTFTVVPAYGVCSAEVGATKAVETWDMNGCDYAFHLEGTKAGSADEYLVKTTVICPESKHITITLFTNATTHAENKPFCHITILQKATDYEGLVAKDTTNGLVDLTGTMPGITARKETGVLCTPAVETKEASLNLDVTIEGKNEAGTKTSIGISHL